MFKQILVLLGLILTIHESKCIGYPEYLTLVAAMTPKTAIERWFLNMECVALDSSKTSRLTVQWFKDGHEFYKYSDVGPKTEIVADKTIGLDIDLTLSDRRWVFINNVTMDAAGIYYCNVTQHSATMNTSLSSNEKKMDIQPYNGFEGVSMAILTERPNINDIIKIRCYYLLRDGNALEYVKWYKNDELFYEYTPNGYQTIKKHGINVLHYGDYKVILKDVNGDAGGRYKCEVKGTGSFGQQSQARTLTIHKI